MHETDISEYDINEADEAWCVLPGGESLVLVLVLLFHLHSSHNAARG